MKKLLGIILSFIFLQTISFSQGQNIEIDFFNGATVNTCDANFYDSGGFAENC